jgi:DNA repair photolyase
LTENGSHTFFRGRGAQVNPESRFNGLQISNAFPEGIDEELQVDSKTEFIFTYPKSIVNRVDSPDIGPGYSMNPYQGCEHGCVYCYARNTHEYWGYGAGLDFERKILVKQNVDQLLEKEFQKKSWHPLPILLSGNTDCYQPAERKFGLTRKLLSVCLKYKHPVVIITKNALVLRDLDILKQLAELSLVKIFMSITGVQEEIRMILEPRTSTYKNRFRAMKMLNENKIPCGLLMAPVVPGINQQEIPSVIKAVAEAGAPFAEYSVVRLNGAVAGIFKDWLQKNHPDRFSKVWNQISDLHGGDVNDTQFGRRMFGEGKFSSIIRDLFDVSRKKFLGEVASINLRTDLFDATAGDRQLRLF